MFVNKVPYTDFHELNLDWVIQQINDFRTQLESLTEGVFEKVMAEVQPQLDALVNDFTNLYASFDNFKHEIANSQAAFEDEINAQIAQLDRDFQAVQDRLAVMVEQVKTYSDVQNDLLYDRISADISSGVIGIGNVRVINYITGQEMTVQEMFDYLCTFHLSNPLTYTHLALKGITYSALAALNLTYTDVTVNGNILIP